MSGPIPKRSEERRRRNKSTTAITRGVGAAKIPPKLKKAKAEWEDIATEWFESLKKSGQAAYYEPSDWAQARLTAELMSRCLADPATPGAVIKEVLRSMDALLTTEGQRRRVRMELERPSENGTPASVTLMSKYREAAMDADDDDTDEE